MSAISIEQAKTITALHVLRIWADAIREAGSIPPGHVYAASMNIINTVDEFNVGIGHLVRAGLVKRNGDVLVWTGPAAGGTVQS